MENWENQPLGQAPTGVDQVPLAGDGEPFETFQIDDTTGPQPVPNLAPDARRDYPARKPKAYSPYQGRMTPQLYELPLEYQLFARAWGAKHPLNTDPDVPFYGYPSMEALFGAWLHDCILRDVTEDVDRPQPEYNWADLYWAQIPQRIQDRLLAQQQAELRQIMQTYRGAWLSSLKADPTKKAWTYDEIQALLTQEETEEDTHATIRD